MNNRLVSFLLLASLSFSSLAAADSSRPDIDELLKVSRVEQQMQDMTAQLEAMVSQSLARMGGTSDIASDQTEKPKWKQLIESEFSWEKTKNEYARIYAEVYTPKEARELIAFYKSPTGQAFLDKSPQLTKQIMELTQTTTTTLVQEMMKLNAAAVPSASPAENIPPDIEELFEASRVREIYEGQEAPAFKKMEAAAKSQGTPAPGKKSPFKSSEEVLKLAKAELGWDRMKIKFARIYEDTFTPDEIKELIAFYKSPTGQMFVETEPLLLQKSTEMGQTIATRIQPVMQEAMLDEAKGAFSAFNGGAATRNPAAALSGTFVLAERPVKSEAYDRIEFYPDWTCRMDIGQQKNLAGKYHITQKGTSLTIDPGPQKVPITYDLSRLDLSVWLTSDKDNYTYIYSLLPQEQPKVTFSDLVGKFLYRDSFSVSVGEITADYKFRTVGWILDSQKHTCTAFHVDGKCEYSGGVMTYYPEHSDLPNQDQYNRDVIVKRDESGFWVVDQGDNQVLCDMEVNSMNPPPPPDGYKVVPK
jgi:hypothetical protein